MSEITLITFSPTGSSLRVAEAIAAGIGTHSQFIDLSHPRQKDTVCLNPIAVIAMPVYAGRVPKVAVERLRELSSRRAKAITIVVYGNRAYEDALLELNDEVEELGFDIVASAAIVAQHCVVPSLATGRPNDADLEELHRFAQTVKDRLETGVIRSPKVPGHRPYRDGMTVSATPIVGEACFGCRTCVTQCPTQAISMNDPKTTDLAKCILCMRCVKLCPAQARMLPPPMQAAMTSKLAPFADLHRDNEFFL